MVPSSTIAITTDGERLTCGGFSLDETVCLRNFEFIVDYFGSLILSPRRGDEGVAFMGSTHSGISNPRWAMIEDSTEEFLMASSEKEASTSLTSEGATRGPCSLPPQPQHDGECSGHTGHDDVSPADGGAAAGDQLPLQATPRSS
jgi:hypothetical protein